MNSRWMGSAVTPNGIPSMKFVLLRLSRTILMIKETVADFRKRFRGLTLEILRIQPFAGVDLCMNRMLSRATYLLFNLAWACLTWYNHWIPIFDVYSCWSLNTTAVLGGCMFITSFLPSIFFASRECSWCANHTFLLWNCKSAWVCLYAPNCTQSWHQYVVFQQKLPLIVELLLQHSFEQGIVWEWLKHPCGGDCIVDVKSADGLTGHSSGMSELTERVGSNQAALNIDATTTFQKFVLCLTFLVQLSKASRHWASVWVHAEQRVSQLYFTRFLQLHWDVRFQKDRSGLLIWDGVWVSH